MAIDGASDGGAGDIANVDSTQPFVSVVVPHFNDLDNLALCLDALRHQTWPAERREIIVADNNSTVGIERVRVVAADIRAAGIQVVPAPEQGAGPARNAGVAAARGTMLAFIDSDCLAAPRWLEAGITALQRFDYVGGQVRTSVRSLAGVSPAEAYELVFAFNFKKYIEQDKFSGSGNLFVPRAIFARVGGFRAGVAEDMDWCWRANALGYRLGYAPDAIVDHAARREWPALTRKWDRVVGEHLTLARERRFWPLRWSLRLAMVAASPIPHALRVVTSDRLPGLRAKLMGLIGLFGIREYRAWQMVVQAIEGVRRR